jgi:hypothetical protein
MSTPGLTSATFRVAPAARNVAVLRTVAVLLGWAVVPTMRLLHAPALAAGLVLVAAACVYGAARLNRRGIWTVSIDRDGVLTSVARCTEMGYTLRTKALLSETATTYAGPASVHVDDAHAQGTVVRDLDMLAVRGFDGGFACVPLRLLNSSPALMAALRTHLLPIGALSGRAVTGPARVLVAA